MPSFKCQEPDGTMELVAKSSVSCLNGLLFGFIDGGTGGGGCCHCFDYS